VSSSTLLWYNVDSLTSFTLSDPRPVTYTDLLEQVGHIASALTHIGFTDSSKPLATRPRVSIYADTSLRWQLMSQTFSRLGHVITTAYTTLGEEGLLRSLVEPDVELVFCGEDQVGMVSKVIEGAEKVKWVIYDADEKRVDQVSVPVRVGLMIRRQLKLFARWSLLVEVKCYPFQT
jgi:long-chain acyl-CoA synthetase